MDRKNLQQMNMMIGHPIDYGKKIENLSDPKICFGPDREKGDHHPANFSSEAGRSYGMLIGMFHR